MIACLGTREGLAGGNTASGYRIEATVPFVALPSVAALRLWVHVLNPRTQIQVRALVLDVGPWNDKDDGYVFQPGTLQPGDLIVAFSDGVTEALNPAGEEFTDDRLIACVTSQNKNPPQAVMNALLADVRAFCADSPQSDDVTVVLVRYNG